MGPIYRIGMSSNENCDAGRNECMDVCMTSMIKGGKTEADT